mmetsp:Transcript_75066/g.141554  ORF Transcript_75066/g.141554 Transcript_75066/m.141554 type:complete len:885 (+) Transcript_75066:88-2742(+)
MRAFALVLAFMACAGRARRFHPQTQQFRGRKTELRRSHPNGEVGAPGAFKALLTLLHSVNPAASWQIGADARLPSQVSPSGHRTARRPAVLRRQQGEEEPSPEGVAAPLQIVARRPAVLTMQEGPGLEEVQKELDAVLKDKAKLEEVKSAFSKLFGQESADQLEKAMREGPSVFVGSDVFRKFAEISKAAEEAEEESEPLSVDQRLRAPLAEINDEDLDENGLYLKKMALQELDEMDEETKKELLFNTTIDLIQRHEPLPLEMEVKREIAMKRFKDLKAVFLELFPEKSDDLEKAEAQLIKQNDERKKISIESLVENIDWSSYGDEKVSQEAKDGVKEMFKAFEEEDKKMPGSDQWLEEQMDFNVQLPAVSSEEKRRLRAEARRKAKEEREVGLQARGQGKGRGAGQGDDALDVEVLTDEAEEEEAELPDGPAPGVTITIRAPVNEIQDLKTELLQETASGADTADILQRFDDAVSPSATTEEELEFQIEDLAARPPLPRPNVAKRTVGWPRRSSPEEAEELEHWEAKYDSLIEDLGDLMDEGVPYQTNTVDTTKQDKFLKIWQQTRAIERRMEQLGSYKHIDEDLLEEIKHSVAGNLGLSTDSDKYITDDEEFAALLEEMKEEILEELEQQESEADAIGTRKLSKADEWAMEEDFHPYDYDFEDELREEEEEDKEQEEEKDKTKDDEEGDEAFSDEESEEEEDEDIYFESVFRLQEKMHELKDKEKYHGLNATEKADLMELEENLGPGKVYPEDPAEKIAFHPLEQWRDGIHNKHRFLIEEIRAKQEELLKPFKEAPSEEEMKDDEEAWTSFERAANESKAREEILKLQEAFLEAVGDDGDDLDKPSEFRSLVNEDNITKFEDGWFQQMVSGWDDIGEARKYI